MAYDPGARIALAKMNKNINILLAAGAKGTAKALEEFGAEYIERMREVLSHEGSGVQYPRMPNRSSAPGEAPAPQTGDYRDSWAYKTGEDKGNPYVDVYTTSPYGPYLEYGTRFMEPRPHVRVVNQAMGEQLTGLVTVEAGDSMKKAWEALRGVVYVDEAIKFGRL